MPLLLRPSQNLAVSFGVLNSASTLALYPEDPGNGRVEFGGSVVPCLGVRSMRGASLISPGEDADCKTGLLALLSVFAMKEPRKYCLDYNSTLLKGLLSRLLFSEARERTRNAKPSMELSKRSENFMIVLFGSHVEPRSLEKFCSAQASFPRPPSTASVQPAGLTSAPTQILVLPRTRPPGANWLRPQT